MDKQITMSLDEYNKLKLIKTANQVRCSEWVEDQSKEVGELISRLNAASKNRVVKVFYNHIDELCGSFLNHRGRKLYQLKTIANKILDDDVKSIHDELVKLCEDYSKELNTIKKMPLWQRVFKWGDQ